VIELTYDLRHAHHPWRSIVLILILEPLPSGIPGHAKAQRAESPAYPPSSRYQTHEIEGWTVLVNQDFLRRSPGLSGSTLNLVRYQLYQIVRQVPAGTVRKLRRVRIWVEEKEPNTLCMTYHPNAAWLEEHGVNPAKVRCVELANARNFLEWTLEQPWMVLHELAHAYHHQFLDGGFENREVKAAYDHAMKLKLYQKVLRIDGRDQDAYAGTNAKEYFAEATEAFFGTNDFYPFVRSELQRHDPVGYNLLVRLWGPAEAAVPD
jgi:hypothetical protein